MDWIEKSRPWVAHEAEIEAAHAPFATQLLKQAAFSDGDRVLDIGCGSGGTTLSIAQLVGTSGAVTGVDIAPPMVDRATERTIHLDHVRIVVADAETYAFTPAQHDAVFSLFGMMFFTDLAAAFANMLQTTRPAGKIHFAAWAAGKHNPWFTYPRLAAEKHLGTLPAQPPNAPGPLAFANTDRVLDMLTQAGWQDAHITPIDLPLTPLHTPAEIATLLFRLGPTANMIADRATTEHERLTLTNAVQADIATSLSTHASPAGIRVPARVNFFSANRAAE